MGPLTKVRVDKWLWAVRAFKTRTAATNACHANKVKVEEKSVKASHLVTIGNTVEYKKTGNIKIYKILSLINKRAAAAIARECYEDLSPPEVKSTRLPSAFVDFPVREKGMGRPTKKERRGIDKLKGKL